MPSVVEFKRNATFTEWIGLLVHGQGSLLPAYKTVSLSS